MTDLGDMLATEHNRLATRGASRYAQSVPDDGAGTDHHERHDMRFFSTDGSTPSGDDFAGVQIVGMPAGMAAALGLDHDCSEHADDTAASIVQARIDGIESEISEITAAMTAEIMRRRAKLDALKLVPTTDPASDGDVVKIVLSMPRAGERAPYTYVGTKAGGAYYLTGRDNAPKSWPELVDFITSGPRRLVSFEIMSTAKPAVESGDATSAVEPAAS